jgi:predicted metalloendopeptidase
MPEEPRLKSTQVQLSLTRRPGNGFYQYVNHAWIKKTHIPSYFSEYGASEQINSENSKEILALVYNLGVSEPKVGEVPTNQKDHLRFFAHIWKHRSAKKEEEHIKILLNDLLYSKEPLNAVHYIGWLIKSGVRTILDLGTSTEERPPFYLRNTLTLGSISLPIKFYYDKTSSVWAAYIKYIDVCSVELGLPYLHHAIEGEIELARIIRMDTNDNDILERHGRDLIHFQSDMPWSPLMEAAEIASWRSRLWLIPDPVCVKRIVKWFIRTSIYRPEVVAAVLTLHLLNSISNHLRPSIRSAAFNLFKKELSGIKTNPSEKMQYISALSETYPDILCSEFSKIDSNTTKLKDLYSLIDKIKASAIDIVQKSKMIHNKTRGLTIEKIHRMKVDIGSNENSYSPQAPYFPDSLIHTIFSINEARYKYLMSKVGKRPNEKDIIYPCFIVNASYYEDYNFMMIPWGILHEPFYSKEAPLGWNYGGIGATLGHELCHAFDVDGIEYNPRAQHKKWWTRKEMSNYRVRTRKIKTFFSKFKHYGLHLDGEKTLAENWADFGGLHVSLNALKAEIDIMGLDEVKRKEAIQTFFISYASSWKDIIRKRKAVHLIQKSVHSLPEDRVDRIVPHFQEWIDAFDIKESDALYIKPSDRLKFF